MKDYLYMMTGGSPDNKIVCHVSFCTYCKCHRR